MPQAERIHGPASKVGHETEGSLEVSVRECNTDDGQRVTTRFVGGVLVDYRITPK